MSTEVTFREALESTGIVQVVRLTVNDKQAHALCRVAAGTKRLWCDMLEYILTRKTCWEDHICQQYFIRGGKLVYGWNVIVIAADELEGAVSEFNGLLTQASQVVRRINTTQVSVDSFPLVGASHRRQSRNIVFDPRLPGPGRGGPSHKGAYEIKGGE